MTATYIKTCDCDDGTPLAAVACFCPRPAREDERETVESVEITTEPRHPFWAMYGDDGTEWAE